MLEPSDSESNQSREFKTEVCVKRYDMLGKRVAGSIPTQGHFCAGFTQVGKRSIILAEARNDRSLSETNRRASGVAERSGSHARSETNSFVLRSTKHDWLETCHVGRDAFRVQGEKTRQIHKMVK